MLLGLLLVLVGLGLVVVGLGLVVVLLVLVVLGLLLGLGSLLPPARRDCYLGTGRCKLLWRQAALSKRIAQACSA